MERVPALGRERVAAQLDVARRAVDVRRDAEALGEDPLRALHLHEDRPRAEEAHEAPVLLEARELRLRADRALEEIEPAENALLRALGNRRHGVRLVLERHVVEDVLARLHHAPQAFADDHGDLVGERGVVAEAVRHDAEEEVAVAVLVL